MLRATVAKFLLLLFGAALVFLGLEVTARVLDRLDLVDYWRPMRTVWIEGTDDWRLNHITADNLREPDPELFWKPVTRSPYNMQRFKGPLMTVPKPREVFRILCYGDSNTDGPKQGSWPEVLQEVLNQHPGSTRRRYEVVNAGVAGYSSHQGLLRFQEEVGTYEPDLVDRAWTKERGIPLLDVEALFENLGAAYFSDECHFTMDGRRKLAEALAAALSREALHKKAA
jgi:hypothetical protein